MKSATLFFALLTMLTVSSCGSSAEEVKQKELEAQQKELQTQQKHEADLKAQEAAIKKRYEEKAALETSLRKFEGSIEEVKNSLVQAKADLSVGYDEMKRIKEWQLGRSSGEREQQIRNQSIYLQNLETEIKKMEAAIGSQSSQIAELKTTLKGFE